LKHINYIHNSNYSEYFDNFISFTDYPGAKIPVKSCCQGNYFNRSYDYYLNVHYFDLVIHHLQRLLAFVISFSFRLISYFSLILLCFTGAS